MAGNPITRIIITAKDEASAVFGSLQAKVAGIATAIAGYFGAQMFGNALGSARDFEAAMSRVQAASGASGEELAQLKAAAEQAGQTTKFTATESAGALENLAKAGLTARQAIDTLPAVLQLAQAGGVELGTAAEFITKAVNGMGIAFSEAGRVADVLAMGANASNTSVEGLAGALSYAAPLANSLGLSLEQTVAIIGKFADAGIDASRAGTALNSILAQFSDPASKFRQELASAGIVTGDFNLALRQLAAKGPEGSKAINAVGQEAGPALRALLNQGIGALDDLKSKLDGAKGSAEATAKTMGQNLDGALKGLNAAWDSARRALVAPLLEPLAKQIDVLAAKFRAAVADGTITRFGEVIRTAFESAVQAVTQFVARVDFGAVIARMQELATQAGAAFKQMADGASTAANVAQYAYGVMSTGTNVVLAAIYKIAEGFSWVASTVLSGVATINEGFAKISFGTLSEGFRQAAAEIQLQAGAMGAVSEAFAEKSSEAFDAAASAAETAATGWQRLTASTQEAAPAVEHVAAQVKAAGEQATQTADQLDALGKGAEFVAGEVKKVGDAAAGQTTKLREMGTEAKASAEMVAAAFDRLGVTSTAALKQTAENAKRDFEMIRTSGTATPRDIQAAFVAYAEKAIAANGGVADAALKAQAAQLNVKIAAEDSGKAVVTAMTAAQVATAALGDSADATAAKFASIGDSAEKSADQVDAAAKKAQAEQDAANEQKKRDDKQRSEQGVGGRDPYAEAVRRGMKIDPTAADDFRDAFNSFFTEQIASIRAGSPFDYSRKQQAAESLSLQQAADFIQTQKSQSTGGGTQTKRFEVRVRFGSRDEVIETADEDSARRLVQLMQDFQRRSA